MMKRRLGKGLDSLISAPQAPPPAQAAAPAAPAEPAAPAPAASRQDIELRFIELNAKQPRERMDEEALKGLADSIRAAGVLQPVIVRPKDGGMFELVAGERRLRAAHLAGLSAVPAIVREVKDEEMLELALIENVQREDLNAMEKAHALSRMTEELKLTQEQVGQKLGLDRSTIANFVRLLELPEEVQEMVSRGTLSAGHARAILALGDPDEQCLLAVKAVNEALSVREIERLAARGLSAAPKPRPALSPQVKLLQQRLQEALGTRVELRTRGKRGRIIVHFSDGEQFDRLFEIMTGTQRPQAQQPAA